MKSSQLISILAQHMYENGDMEVFVSPEDLKKPYREITNCWYNHGQDYNEQNRIIISSKEPVSKGQDYGRD